MYYSIMFGLDYLGPIPVCKQCDGDGHGLAFNGVTILDSEIDV